MEAVANSQKSGEIIRDGFKVALAGRPNAGKSSLMNALVQRDVAIVTDVAGTTRDIIRCELDLDGYKVNLFDTRDCGIRTRLSKEKAFDELMKPSQMRILSFILWT